MTKADHAITAVTNIESWGLWAACRYAKNHGISCRLFLLTLRLERQAQAEARAYKFLPIFLKPQAE